MNKEQALQIIKQTLDLAIKSGVATTLQDANLIAVAFQTITKELSGGNIQ